MNNNYTLTITKSEAESMVDFIECAFIPYIREDTCVDNVMWVANICNIYKRMKEIVDGVKEEEREKKNPLRYQPGYGLCYMCKHAYTPSSDIPCCGCIHIGDGESDNWKPKETEDEENGNNIRNNHRTCDCGSCGSDSECVHALFD